ncbi:MAG: hypothetical protein CVU96_04255 [Firmicutes bacterium HGW-Firmicutes-20]|jgi:hypothetical protein|nr:MAG: hypothetical protein CVU96_04255 [Firmicutes bacterium HGW-Firmicutes-20]PKM67588.1 MAG: hypothetical protein CVU94_06450 [Firmicutes bacterium HGW-Firmicutes-19]
MEHKSLAAELFNKTWDYLDNKVRSSQDDLDMITLAHASLYHWMQVNNPEYMYIGYWQISRVYAMLNLGDTALMFAKASLKVCVDHAFEGFNLAYAYEAMARSHAINNQKEEAKEYSQRAVDESEKIMKQEHREMLLSDLTSIFEN